MTQTAQVIDFQQARARRTSEPWVSKAEVARHRGVSERTVNRWMTRGLPYSKRFEHSFPRFQLSGVDAWMEGRDG